MAHRDERSRPQTPVMRILNGLFTLALAAACGVALVALVIAVVYIVRMFIWTP